jgi:hypothetical protein
MADSNIFQQYLVPPKSVMEYSAEMDQADARRQSLQQNALTLAAGQQKFNEGQQASQRAEQLRNALMGLPQGATDDQRVQAMRGTATPEGFAAADALSKSLIDQRKGTAAAAKDEADAAKTSLARDVALHDFHAQRLATVQTPEDALAWAQEGNALGLFKQPGQYDRGVAMIQQAAQSPEAFAQWKAAAMQGGQSITEQLKQQLEQAKQAEQVRQFGVTDQRIQSEGAANRVNQVKVQQMITDRLGSQGNIEPTLSADTRTRIARQFLKGDKSGLQNLGRGAQGAANLVALQNDITAEAGRQGMSGEDIAARMAEFEGLKAGMRATGNISARVENAAAEAANLAPLAVQASRDVVRSGFLPFGKVQIMFDTNANDPALAKFATANLGLATAYASAMARGNKPTVSDNEHARALLSTAKSQAAYEATVAQMQAEIAQAQAAPKSVRKDLSNSISGRGEAPAAAPAAKPGGGKPSLSDIFGH